MADNTQLGVGVGGDIIRDEDLGAGVKMPVSKIYTGAAGVDGGPVTADNRLPVATASNVAPGSDTDNVDVTLLGGADSYGLAQELRVRLLSGRNELSTTDQSVITCLSDLQIELCRILQGGGEGPLNVRINDPAPIAGTGQVGQEARGMVPILNGAIDTTNKLRTLLVDTLGRLNAVGPAAPGAVIALAGNPVYNGLSDGTAVRAVLGDTSGRQIAVGAAANAGAVTGNPILNAGYDGTLTRTLRTDLLGRLYVVDTGLDQQNVSRTLALDTRGRQDITNDSETTLLQGIQDRLDTMISLLQFMTGTT
jgi:hypothetical protein